MGLFLRQDENRTKFQERLAAELREKVKQRAELENGNGPYDPLNDSNYLKDTKTTSLLWLWVLLYFGAATILAYIIAEAFV